MNNRRQIRVVFLRIFTLSFALTVGCADQTGVLTTIAPSAAPNASDKDNVLQTFPLLPPDPMESSARPDKILIRDEKVYLLFSMDGKEYQVLLAGVSVPLGQEKIAIACIDAAAAYVWRIGSGDPVTNEHGELQIRVVYEMDGVTRDLSLAIRGAILDSGH